MKKRMGRPPKPRAERKTRTVRLRMSSAEHKKLEELAKAEGLSVSEFLRRKAKGE
jgi:predicted HicB family RNase H-like nuclease